MHIKNIFEKINEFEAIEIYLSKLNIVEEYKSKIHDGDLTVDFQYSDNFFKKIISEINGLFEEVENGYGYKYWKLNLKEKLSDYNEPLYTKEELIEIIFNKTDPTKQLKRLVNIKTKLKDEKI